MGAYKNGYIRRYRHLPSRRPLAQYELVVWMQPDARTRSSQSTAWRFQNGGGALTSATHSRIH